MKLTFLFIIPNYWGKADTPEGAKANAQKESGKRITSTTPQVLYITNDPGCSVDSIDGGFCYHTKEGLWATKIHNGKQIEVHG